MSSSLLRSFSSRRLATRLYSTSSASQPRASSSLVRGLVLAAALGTAYTAGSLYPPTLATFISPRIAPTLPKANTPEGEAYTAALEQEIVSLPLLKAHRLQEDADDWYEARPYTDYPAAKLANHFTAGALRGPGLLAVRPVIRAKKDESEAWVVIHLGRALCGHEGIVHGGLMATLLDEALARTAFFNLPAKVALTANLSVNYRAPTKADQFVVIKTTLIEQKGRKAVISARVEDMDGNLLQDATGLFIQPKFAGLLNAGPIAAMVGQRKDMKDGTPVVASPIATEAGIIKA